MVPATRKRRPRRPPGVIFLSTAFVVLLFASYSLLRPAIEDLSQPIHGLQSHSLQKRDEECRLVHNAGDKCAFIRANCPDEEAGLISYLQLYYCDLAHLKPVAFAILVTWISLLFSTIGIAASDFLCVNLSTIATVLGMSESLTGVTFLAFGNGSPDVFSTFAAMSTNSGSLAIGELMGAAGFITAVVAGSMALVKPFKVAKKSFVRDVSFFAVAASFSLIFLYDGSLRLWECAAMVGFYVFYVIFVVTWHWWLQRTRRIRLSEATARLHHHIPEHQELEVPEIDVDEESAPAGERTSLLRTESGSSVPTLMTPGTPVWKMQVDDEDDETRDRYLAELQSNMRVSRPGRERRNTITPIRPSLVGALEFRSVLSSLEKKATSHQQSIGLRRYSDDHSDTGEATLATTSHPEHIGDRTIRRSRSQGRNRAVSANDAEGLRLSPSVLEGTDSRILGTGQFQVAPQAISNGHRHTQSHFTTRDHHSPLLLSPSPLLSPGQMSPQLGESRSPVSAYVEHNGLLAPPTSDFTRPDYNETDQLKGPSPAISPNMDVPILQIPNPKNRHSPIISQLGSPVSSPSHSRAPSIRLPPPSLSLSPESTRELALLPDDEEEVELRKYKWWPYQHLPPPQVLLATLFPTIYGWKDKTLLGKLFGVVSAPSVFLLTITLPVVESQDESNELDEDIISPERGHSRSNTLTQSHFESSSNEPGNSSVNGNGTAHPHGANMVRRASEYTKGPIVEEVGVSKDRNWNRWLVIVQIFTAPLFTVCIIWANLEDHTGKQLLLFILSSAVFSLIGLFFVLATTSPEREPKFRPVFCFLGFAVAVAWISTIANEVVGVLKAIGVILNISDAILGLTIFAVGNSLGDLVADITVAKLGYPVMALSACFGGPMLNILLGVGIGGMYMTIHKGQRQHHKHPNKPIKYKPYELEVNTTLMISGITLLVTLVGLLIVVPLNGWRMDRKIGIGLITLWSLSTLGNVICEILGVGSEWESTVL